MRLLIHELEDLRDVPVQLHVEAFRVDDCSMTLRPQASMTDLEQIEGQLLFAREVLVQSRIGVATLIVNVANRRGSEAVLAEQLKGRAEDLPLGGGIVLVNVEGQ